MNFNKPAEYNQSAELQKKVAAKLVEMAKGDIMLAEQMVDLCCGTGFIAEHALKVNPELKIIGVDASYEMCEFTTQKGGYDQVLNIDLNEGFEDLQSHNLAISSMALHWLRHPLQVARKFKKIYFAVPLFGSLHEISTCFEREGMTNPLVSFWKDGEGLIATHEYEEKFENLIEALKSFNKIGAKNVGYKEVLTPSKIRRLEKHFEGKMSWKIGFFMLKS